LFDVDLALDMLAAQTQYAQGEKDEVNILGYRDYMALFATDSPAFYPPPSRPPTPKPTLRQRFNAALRAWDDWFYAEQLEIDRRRQAMLDAKRKARAARTRTT
jgi:hypothetical protein